MLYVYICGEDDVASSFKKYKVKSYKMASLTNQCFLSAVLCIALVSISGKGKRKVLS